MRSTPHPAGTAARYAWYEARAADGPEWQYALTEAQKVKTGWLDHKLGWNAHPGIPEPAGSRVTSSLSPFSRN
jgi:hypothetical protein